MGRIINFIIIDRVDFFIKIHRNLTMNDLEILEGTGFLDQAIAAFGNQETDMLGINNIPSSDVTLGVSIATQTTDDSDALLLPNNPSILNISGLAGKDLLTGEIASQVSEQLKQFAADPNFSDKMNLAFGDSWNVDTANAITQQWLAGDFSQIPEIEVVSTDDIAGADGAFAGATETIYISQEWLELNASNPGAIASVVLEEIGHYFDYEINIVDAAGDEGAIFSAGVRGEELTATEVAALKAEDDQLIVSIDGRSVLLEHSSSDWTTKVYDWDFNVLGETSIVKRSDGLNGIDVDWGNGSVVGEREDEFIVGTWHQAYFDANTTYNFTVQGDDGFWIFTSPDGDNWTRFSDDWDFAYRDQNAKEYSWTPETSGDHYVYAFLFEREGDAYFDLAWSSDNDSDSYFPELRSLSDADWDEQTSDNTGFSDGWPDYFYDSNLASDEVEEIYADLNLDLFENTTPYDMTAGYMDPGYFEGLGSWHAGIDIGATTGTEVKAVAPGTVQWVDGSFIGIRSLSGNGQWVYGHLNINNFSQGDEITKGDVLGTVDSANHLHFETRTPEGFGGTGGRSPDKDFIQRATMSPLQAYWISRN